jgi:hypothetical protein
VSRCGCLSGEFVQTLDSLLGDSHASSSELGRGIGCAPRLHPVAFCPGLSIWPTCASSTTSNSPTVSTGAASGRRSTTSDRHST